MRSIRDLQQTLQRIDRRGYSAYRDLRGDYDLGDLTVSIDHVQADPFAAPSRVRIRLDQSEAAFPSALMTQGIRRMALGDFLAREVRSCLSEGRFRREAKRQKPSSGHGRTGLVMIDSGGQEVLERSAIWLTPEYVEARLEVGLPAQGRRVLADAAGEILLGHLPEIARKALHWTQIDPAAAQHHVETVENQEYIRSWLAEQGLVAFVANGSILPRESGVSDRPMATPQAVAFQSPESLQVEAPLLNPIAQPDGMRGTILGLGIPSGVSLIVGGGYHGKSTLLQAVESAVYPHIPGDGREYVVSHRDLVKIRAEDGRAVTGVDIHGFIDQLPKPSHQTGGGEPLRTHFFSTEDASGSTSQAAAIVEAIESGAAGILLDEDTCATNFMVRDARMQELVHRDHEPITPLVDRVRELYERWGISTLLVMGGSGDYFEVADTVIRLQAYEVENVTQEARDIATRSPNGRSNEVREPLMKIPSRRPLRASINASKGRKRINIAAKGPETLQFGEIQVDLRQLPQNVESSQTRAIGLAIHRASLQFMDHGGPRAAHDDGSLAKILDQIEQALDQNGLDWLESSDREGPSRRFYPGRLSRPRRHEIAATHNRMRNLKVARPLTSPPSPPDDDDALPGDPETPDQTWPA
ncbi:ABC-ATPase domain-containing protein [Myxococcota bacterium]|nr:ABC-ATPase domain-containing protein [Myxococcota bacterium]